MRKNQHTTLMAIGSALFAVAPKCPICLLAYFGIFGVAASSASAYRAWLPPIAGFWLSLTIAMLAVQQREKRRYGPAALGFVAALLILVGKFAVDSRIMVFTGVIILLSAAFWRSHLQQRVSTPVCLQCEELPLLEDK